MPDWSKMIPWIVGLVLLAVVVSQAVGRGQLEAKAAIFEARADSLRDQGLQERERADNAEGLARNLQAAFETSEFERARERLRSDERLVRLQGDLDAEQAARAALLAGEAGNLSPEAMAIVQPVYDSYESEIATLNEKVVEIERREASANERADEAVATAVAWMRSDSEKAAVIRTLTAENASLRVAIDARRSQRGRWLGIIPKIDGLSYVLGAATVCAAIC